MPSRVFPACPAVLWLLLRSAPGAETVSRDDALAAAFPGATIRPERVFLTDTQRKQAASLSGVEVASALVARYTAVSNGIVVGRAYVDTHAVRSKNESLLVILEPSGAVRRIEVTAFLEPPEYQAASAWYRQYHGRHLSDDLNLDRAIRTVAGATLTARATTRAVRRVLAIDQVLRASGGTR